MDPKTAKEDFRSWIPGFAILSGDLENTQVRPQVKKGEKGSLIEELNGRRWGEGDFNKERNKLIYNSKREPNAKWIRMKAGERPPVYNERVVWNHCVHASRVIACTDEGDCYWLVLNDERMGKFFRGSFDGRCHLYILPAF